MAVVMGGAKVGKSSKHSSATFVQGFRLVTRPRALAPPVLSAQCGAGPFDFKVAVASLVKEACCVPLPLLSPFLRFF
jgi:hypothetical protein